MNPTKIKLPFQDFNRKKGLPADYPVGQHYRIISKVGTGNYGTVFKATDLRYDNAIVAIKIINMFKILSNTENENAKKLLRMSVTEPMNLRAVDSPHVAKYYEQMENEQGTLKLLVMQYCEGPTLEFHISELRKKNMMLSQKQAFEVFYDVVKGIKAIHDKNIMHRDLHPGNIIRNGSNWVIVDLGFSKMVAQAQSIQKGTSLGALIIKAPEIINPKAKYGLKADIWSLGVNLFFLLTTRYLFTEQQCELYPYEILEIIKKRLQIQFGSNEEEVTQIVQEQSEMTDSSECPILKGFNVQNKAKDFLKQVLQFDSVNRMTAKQLLRHKIFDQYGVRAEKEKKQIAQGIEKNKQSKHDEESEVTYDQECNKWLSSFLSKQY